MNKNRTIGAVSHNHPRAFPLNVVISPTAPMSDRVSLRARPRGAKLFAFAPRAVLIAKRGERSDPGLPQPGQAKQSPAFTKGEIASLPLVARNDKSLFQPQLIVSFSRSRIHKPAGGYRPDRSAPEWPHNPKTP